MNAGKIFEQEIKESIQNDIFYLRIKDSASSFRKDSSATRFTLTNPCDTIFYKKPYIYLIELKTTQGSSLPFNNIKEHQIKSLKEYSKYEGIVSGFIINFREKETTYFLDIGNFSNFFDNTTKKSINITDIEDFGGILIPQKKKRIRYVYDLGVIIK